MVVVGIMVLHQESVAQLPFDDAIYSRQINKLCAARIMVISCSRLEQTFK